MLRAIAAFFLALLAALGIAVLVASLVDEPDPGYDFYQGQTGPMVIAHQGGEGLRPSNTLVAFRNAAEMGVDVLEMDVHRTADGALVLIHDATVERTTGGQGRVMDLTLEEIKSLDAGWYWTPDDGQTYPFRGQGISIPTLGEVLTAFPDLKYNIEIKQVEPSIAVQLCEELRRHGVARRALVASFHPQAMDEFRSACPETPTSMVEDEIRPFFILNTIFLGSLYDPPGTAFQVPEFSGNLRVLTERFVRGAHAAGFYVHPWTIDDPADMQRFIDMGVDGIITDRPDVMLELLGR
jgi:glycerophosphoryl diester phosphodiesterase